MEENIVLKLLETIQKKDELIGELVKAITKIQPPNTFVGPRMGSVPLYIPETEQDALFQLENGLIDKKEFAEILSELRFHNPEVEIYGGSA